MPAPLPDALTALGMTAMSAGTAAWVMWALCRQYWRQGMAWAFTSTVLYGLTALLFALQNLQASMELRVASTVLASTAIATFSIALERFSQRHHLLQEVVTVMLPLLASLMLLAAGPVLADLARSHLLQLVIYLLQTSYVLAALLRLRSSTPGRGWRLVSAAVLLQMAVLWVLILSPGHSPTGWTIQAFNHPLAMWMLCLAPLLLLLVGSIGFLLMLQERETAFEQGKAQLDPLTQLPNRAALVRNLQQSIEAAAQQQQPLAVMVLDIDHFKSVNDNYGHLVGDQVIQSIARTLTDEGRSSDFSARYGGEEFVVVLPNTSAREAFHWAERLCQAVRKTPMQLPNGRLLHITISVGVYAGMPTHGNAWERMVGAADEAMYVAKRNGRDRVAMSALVQTMRAQTTAMD